MIYMRNITITTAKSATYLENVGPNGFDWSDTGFTLATFAPTSAVPEPATWAMMIAGFGVVGGAVRRRRPAALAA